MLGVILNAFVPGRAQGHYAYSSYIDDYAPEDEPEDPKALLGAVKR